MKFTFSKWQSVFLANTLRTAGRIWKKDRVSLTNFPPKGYEALWALGLEFNGAS
jgi:hypothetical protein